jgi:hypothetical protein
VLVARSEDNIKGTNVPTVLPVIVFLAKPVVISIAAVVPPFRSVAVLVSAKPSPEISELSVIVAVVAIVLFYLFSYFLFVYKNHIF